MKSSQNDVLYSKIQTDENLMENVNRGQTDYPFYYYYENINQFDFRRIDWHWHDEFEFIYIERGHLNTYVGSEKVCVSAGEALFINSKRLHSFDSDEDTDLPNFLFPPTFISESGEHINRQYVQPVVASGLDYIVFSKEIYWQKKAIDIIRQIISVNSAAKDDKIIEFHIESCLLPSYSYELITASLLMQLWTLIYDKSEFEKLKAIDEHQASARARLEVMMQFIHSNYAEHISLDEIASSANISKSSALNLFNEFLRITPVMYLIQYRLKVAAKLLRSTDASINSIADETGFESTGYFCRKFKKMYLSTPSEYRSAGK